MGKGYYVAGEKGTCDGCKHVHVRAIGRKRNCNFQRVCKRGSKNPDKVYLRLTEGRLNIGCKHYDV